MLTVSLSDGDIGKVKEITEERIIKKGKLNVVVRDAWRCLETSLRNNIWR